MGIKGDVLSYLLTYGEESMYRLANILKIDEDELMKTLRILEEQGNIKIRGQKVNPVKEKILFEIV